MPLRNIMRGPIEPTMPQLELWAEYDNGASEAFTGNMNEANIITDALIFFRQKTSLLRHNRFSTLFFSMKIEETGKIFLVSCIIDFNDKQV